MIFKEGFTSNEGINIHYMDNEVKDTEKTPLLICPGLSESDKDYENLITNIKDRRCIALSFRGRGKSDSPKSNYTLENHIADIEAVVSKLNLKDFCIMGVSRGVSYVLGYSILNNSLLKGIIIDEYPAEHKKMPTGWADESIKFYKEHCESISITYDVLKAIEIDSIHVNFKYSLHKITCPSLILKGELEDSLLSDNNLIDYVNNLGSENVTIEKFKEAGHDIQSNDFKGLVKVINEFLESIDE